MQLGVLFSAVTGCKKAVDAVTNVQRVPDQVAHVVSVIEAAGPALKLAYRLQSRHATAALVTPAVNCVNAALAACDRVLDDCPDIAADTETSNPWDLWLQSAPKRLITEYATNASRLGLLPIVRQQLCESLAALQLALTAVQLEFSEASHVRRGCQPHGFDGDAFARAHLILQLMDMGRLAPLPHRSPETLRYPLCAGHVRRVTSAHGLKDLGFCGITLERSAAGKNGQAPHHALAFYRAKPGEDVGEERHRVELSAAVLAGGVRRIEPHATSTGSTIDALDQDNRLSALTQYHIGDTVIAFMPLASPWSLVPEYPARGDERYLSVTSEMFESLIVMIALMTARGAASVDAVENSETAFVTAAKEVFAGFETKLIL
jgi:hypothetical protein